MAKVLQFRRDTTSGISTITGSAGELFVDLSKDTLVVMDGSTTGGQALQKEITGSTNINAGITTASSFVGPLTGNVTGNINSSGINTLTSLNSTDINASGIITASSLYVTSPFILNPNTINANYTVPVNFNAMTIGPSITVSSGVVVTVPSGAKWSVVP